LLLLLLLLYLLTLLNLVKNGQFLVYLAHIYAKETQIGLVLPEQLVHG
jgi:hypothetical protein